MNVGVIIGDEDSSTIAAVRRENNNVIHKLADNNHLIKHFVSELYDLAKTFKELKKQGVINHLKKCFCYAIAQNKGSSTDVAQAIKSIPDHVYNQHENCGEWCKRENDNKNQKIILKDELLYNSLRDIFLKYSNNSSKFSVAASSQANESLNSVIASRAPKAKCYSRTGSADYRVASAILTKNEGAYGLVKVKERFGFALGTHTKKYYTKADNLRKIKSIGKKTRKQKLRRVQLTLMRENLRKKKKNLKVSHTKAIVG